MSLVAISVRCDRSKPQLINQYCMTMTSWFWPLCMLAHHCQLTPHLTTYLLSWSAAEVFLRGRLNLPLRLPHRSFCFCFPLGSRGCLLLLGQHLAVLWFCLLLDDPLLATCEELVLCSIHWNPMNSKWTRNDLELTSNWPQTELELTSNWPNYAALCKHV